MLGTVLSIIGALCYSLLGTPVIPAEAFLLTAAFLFLGVGLLATALIWQPLVRTEQKTIACAQELFIKDYWLKASLGALFAFTLFSFSSYHFGTNTIWVL